MEKCNLLKVFLKKEKTFWKRTIKGLNVKKADWVTKFLVILFSALGHYVFAVMHFLFEVGLWIFCRPLFKQNLQALQKNLSTP